MNRVIPGMIQVQWIIINLVISVLETNYFQKVPSDFEEDEILSQLFEGNRKGGQGWQGTGIKFTNVMKMQRGGVFQLRSLDDINKYCLHFLLL